MGKKYISEFVLLPHQYCEYQNSDFEYLLQNCTFNSSLEHQIDVEFKDPELSFILSS